MIYPQQHVAAIPVPRLRDVIPASLVYTATEVAHHWGVLARAAETFGPEPQDYATVQKSMTWLGMRKYFGLLDTAQYAHIWQTLGATFKRESLLGRVYTKPLGYAGDYTLIDDIYGYRVSKQYARWDHLVHWMSATQAVRNRKDYFKAWLTQVLQERSGPIRVLDLACGPCRDVAELLSEVPEARQRLSFVCLDQDALALAHAKTVCVDHLDNITFVECNAFRYVADKPFDLVWSAGLFDYLTDALFISLLRRLHPMLVPGGELVVGNFSEDNPNIWAMEFSEWTLLHRSSETLQSLAQRGRFAGDIRVGSESYGINYFLHARP